MTRRPGPWSWALAYLVAILRDRLGLRGNDGLTARERRVYAERYRAAVMAPLSAGERAAYAEWRADRARRVKRAGGDS